MRQRPVATPAHRIASAHGGRHLVAAVVAALWLAPRAAQAQSAQDAARAADDDASAPSGTETHDATEPTGDDAGPGAAGDAGGAAPDGGEAAGDPDASAPPASTPASAPTARASAPTAPASALTATPAAPAPAASAPAASAPAATAPAAPTPARRARAPRATSAPEPPEQGVTVRGDAPLSAASSVSVRDRDLALRPRTRPADLLEVAPGLLVVQHAGGGKANQYFLRGFDADHGTDIALSVDGVPFNNVSHAHGQGYADPHFIIPELVERVDVQEGPYFAASGDFATAGAIDLRLRRTVDRSSLMVEAGMYGRYRMLGVLRTNVGPVRGYLAAELSHYDGAFTNPTNFNRYNALGRWTVALGPRVDLTLTLSSYGGVWNASGQVPARLVGQQYMGRLFTPFDSVDPTEGGSSDRHSAYAELRARGTGGSETNVLAYLVRYRLDLFSNFTYFANDPVHGDGIEQADARTIGGFRVTHRMRHALGGWRFETLLGAQMRHDAIDNGLFHQQARERLDAVNQAGIRQTSFGVFAQEEVRPVRWLRLIGGLRADLFSFGVDDHSPTPGADTGGAQQRAIVSPKATVVFNPLSDLDVYLNFGTGFHSNDARGVVRLRDPVTALARAIGYEAGARWRFARRFELAVAAWGLDLESEIVWSGDDGTTEARGPTRRLGVTVEGRAELTSWLRADVDVSYVSATFTQNPGNANAVALAPPWTISAGLSARHAATGLFGAARLRAISDRPATEDRSLTAQGFAIVSAQLGYRHRWFEVAVDVQNALNSSWREAQFASSSRLAGEAAPVTDIHFTPGSPFAATGRLTVYAP